MKDFSEMSFSEKVNYATGVLCVAIGNGTFKDEVARLIEAAAREGFGRGKAVGETVGYDRGVEDGRKAEAANGFGRTAFDGPAGREKA